MSFADYLRDRISNDYKNLIAQKLEEIRQQTEQLRNRFIPSFDQNQQAAREAMQNEIGRIQESIERELSDSQNRISADFHSLLDAHIASLEEMATIPAEQQLEALLSDIVSNAPVPTRNKTSEIQSLAELMKKLDQQNTQSEILNTLLMHISSWVDRAVLFVVKGDQAAGWAALGLGGDWNTARVRSMRVALNKQTILKDVLTSTEISYGTADRYPDNNDIYLSIGNKFPKAVVACPIKVRGKIAGVLYCDFDHDFEDQPDLPDLLFLASRAAGFAIDLLPLKPKLVTPVPTPTQTVTPVEVQQEQVPSPSQPEAIPEITTPVSAIQEVAQAVQEVEQQEEEEAEGTVIMPAPVIPPVIREEDQKLHDDAKRFARLLVSEIKLYNEAQVAAGREHRDLYERLREDIERSRKMYQDRVPTNIHSSTNYFYEELVRTLANGDPTLLGM